ncbi:YggN family protein [Pseudoalteromonas sp. SSDWG2]|uniref:YggN family protein n=1 Tax=Pseudoalteromonas sp. SSDWG2 TaxID=3139391 RepID=UPI003BAD8C97
MKLHRWIVSLGVCTLLSVPVSAEVSEQGHCDVELTHGLIITSDTIRIVDNNQTRVQINQGNQLLVRGQWIELNAQEMEVLGQYEQMIRSTVPELVELATDGVNLGLSAIEDVVTGLSDKEPEVLREQLQYVERALRDKFKRGDDFFYIAPQSLSKLDDFFTQEVSKKMHTAIQGSLGAMLVTLGDALESREGNIEERISDMGERMQIITAEIDKSLQKKAQQLTQKSQEYCNCLNSLDSTESRLQKIVPELADFDLVKIKQN